MIADSSSVTPYVTSGKMVTYGKKFKKTKLENLDELFEALESPEKMRQLIKNMDVLTTFLKNDDGSIQSIIMKSDGEEVFSHKLVPDAETDITAPDGTKLKVFCQTKDDRIESVISFPEGGKIHMDRVFEGDVFKLIIYKEGIDIKGVITHQAV